MFLQEVDVRVSHAPREQKALRAAKSAAAFIRRQVDLSDPSSKEEMVEGIWRMYWKMHRAGLVAAPRLTRSVLRKKYGIWSQVGVQSRFLAA